MRVAMNVYTGDHFSARRTRHERLNTVEFALRELPVGVLGQLQLLLHHSVGADVVDDRVRRRRRHERQFGGYARRARRTAEDSTQPLNGVPSHVLAAAAHFSSGRRRSITFVVRNTAACTAVYDRTTVLTAVENFTRAFSVFTGQRTAHGRN